MKPERKKNVCNIKGLAARELVVGGRQEDGSRLTIS